MAKRPTSRRRGPSARLGRPAKNRPGRAFVWNVARSVRVSSVASARPSSTLPAPTTISQSRVDSYADFATPPAATAPLRFMSTSESSTFDAASNDAFASTMRVAASLFRPARESAMTSFQATPYAAQIQGVFVPEAHRGTGLATAGMAGVVEIVRREIAPTVSLYVNEWNTSARAVYQKVGFRESTRFATVMY